MNYKIKITKDNREAIKDIAERNGMNHENWDFKKPLYYFISNGKFPKLIYDDNFLDWQELTFEQFKEMFDKQESLVGRYFKALVNNALGSNIIPNEYYKIEIEDEKSIYFKVPASENPTYNYSLVKKSKIKFYELMPIGFDPKQETPIEFKEEMLGGIVPPNKVTVIEKEWQPKRGDRVLVTNDTFIGYIERIYFDKVGANFLALPLEEYEDFTLGRDFVLEQYKHMKPLPIETTTEKSYKDKVIKVIEDVILEITENIKNNLESEFYGLAHTNKQKRKEAEYILKQIKELN